MSGDDTIMHHHKHTLLALLSATMLLATWTTACTDDDGPGDNAAADMGATTEDMGATTEDMGDTTPGEDMGGTDDDGGSGAIRVGLVVLGSSGTPEEHCVELQGAADPLAVDVLEASPLMITTEPNEMFGPALCAIEGDGCPMDHCFGCDEAMGMGWAFFTLEGSAWASAADGVGALPVAEGDVLGFSFTTFDPETFEPGDEPPVRTFAELCP